jgi:hypothetical protein
LIKLRLFIVMYLKLFLRLTGMIGKGVLIPTVKLRAAHIERGMPWLPSEMGTARRALVLTTARKVKLSLLDH